MPTEKIFSISVIKSCFAKTITLSPTSIVVEPVGNITDLFLINAPIATPSGRGLSLKKDAIGVKVEGCVANQ